MAEAQVFCGARRCYDANCRNDVPYPKRSGFGTLTSPFPGSLSISIERHRKRHLAARGVAFDRAPVVGVDQRPMRDSLGSAAARRWEGPLKLPQKASFLGMICHVTKGRVLRECSETARFRAPPGAPLDGDPAAVCVCRGGGGGKWLSWDQVDHPPPTHTSPLRPTEWCVNPP